MVLPKLSDVELMRRTFSPGDRMIVRTTTKLRPDQQASIKRVIYKMTGEHVRVLIVDVRFIKLVWYIAAEDRPVTLTGLDDVIEQKIEKGRIQLDCSTVDFNAGDRLVVFIPPKMDAGQRAAVVESLSRWIGEEDVEIQIEKGMFWNGKTKLKTFSGVMSH